MQHYSWGYNLTSSHDLSSSPSICRCCSYCSKWATERGGLKQSWEHFSCSSCVSWRRPRVSAWDCSCQITLRIASALFDAYRNNSCYTVIYLTEKKWRRQIIILWLVGNNNFGVFVDNRTAVVGNLSIDFEFPCSHCWVFRANELQIWHPGPRKYTLLILWCCEKLHCDGCWISNYGISGSHTSDCKWSPRYLHISKVTK